MKICKGIIFFIGCLFLFSFAEAQQADSSHLNSKEVTKSDITDSAYLKKQISVVELLHDIFPRTKLFEPDTIIKRKGRLYTSIVPLAGYSLHAGYAAAISFNGAFYTENPDSVNLSYATLLPTITINKQFVFPFQTNIWTKNNKYNLLGNWVYYKFPELTYGLGGHTSLSDADPIDYSYLLFHETILRSVAPDLFLGLGYDLDYHWKVTESGMTDGSESDFRKYGLSPTSTSSGVTYNFLYDNRRNPINPPGGTEYANVVVRTNYTLLGSNQNWSSLAVDLRKYFSFPRSSHNVLAFWSYDWLTLSGKPPYLDLPSTGWDTYNNQGRGYIQSRFKGNDLLALESEYRFSITRNGLLGAVVFVNAQSVPDWPGNKFTTVWPAVGTGIRVKLNKHSNTNGSVDYAFGLGGSRGFFVNMGEVF